jgi:hypothetical protein
MNDKKKKVKVLFDTYLYEAPWASFHPMDNCASTAISRDGIEKIRKLHGGEFTLFDFENTVAVEEDHSDPEPVQDLPDYKSFDPQELPWNEKDQKLIRMLNKVRT